MGKQDTLTKEYISDNEVFADAFNYFIYDGKQVIKKENLQELNTNEFLSLNKKKLQVFRDVLKCLTIKQDNEFTYLLLGIENQTNIHYAMPLRIMLYDALQYNNQIRAINKRNKNDKINMSKDEYLSGFRKNDKLHPIISLVVYFGADPWDGPKSLHEMFDVKDTSLLKYVKDYKIDLLEPSTILDKDFNKFRSDFGDIFHFIKYSNDKDKLYTLLKNNENYLSMKRSSAELLKTLTNAKINLPKEEERNVNMCLAIEQMRQEAIELGKNEGVELGKSEGIEIGKNEGIEIGKNEGIELGKLYTLFELVNEGLLTIKQASTKAKLTEEEFKTKMFETGYVS